MDKDNFKFGERLEFYKPDFEMRKQIAELHLKAFQNCVVQYWDKLKDYIEYNSPEETIAHYEFNDYNHLWDCCRRDHIVLLPNEEVVDVESIFDKFSNEQLKDWFNSDEMFKVVRYFKWYRDTHKQFNKIFSKNNSNDDIEHGLYYNERFFIGLRHANYQAMLADESKEYTEKETEELENGIDATEYLKNVLSNPLKNHELCNMLLNYLQYVSINDLKKLLRLMKTGFEIKEKGRPVFNIPIYVLDKYGELVVRYNNRQECMDKEGLGKVYLSQLLSGNKKRKKCSYCEMTDEEYEEHRKIFNKMKI